VWRGSSPWHPSPRLRAIGAALLPLLLVLALPACRTGTVCNAAIAPTPAPALTAASGAVYANEWGSVSALRGASGALVWHASVGFVPAATAAIVANGLVIVSTGAGKLSAIRISDGSRAWQSQPVPHPASGDLLPLPVPVVAGDTLYAAAGPGSVAAWRSADGSLLWQSQPVAVPVDPAYGTGYASLPEPVVAAGIVYFSAGQTVRAVRAADGSLLWSSPALQPENLYTPPVLADGRLFLVARDDSLYALDAGSGAVLWHAPDPGTAGLPFIAFPASPALPVVQDGVVYYAPLDGPRALATSTGALLWHLAAGDPSAGPSPVVAAGAVYVAMGGNLTVLGTRTGAPATLWALNARTGAVKWKTA
jgi:outer membrane protein assembly factor BamB